MEDEADQISFSRHIVPEYERVVKAANRILHDQHEAEDVAQDTMLKMATQIKRIKAQVQNDNELANYAVCIAKNLAINKLKSKQRISILSGRAAEPIMKEDDLVFRCEDQELISAHLDRLDEKYQIVIRLIYFNGLTVKEAAKALDRKPGTVYKQHQRGLKLLKMSMQKENMSK